MKRILEQNVFESLISKSDPHPCHDEVVLIAASMAKEIHLRATLNGWIGSTRILDPYCGGAGAMVVWDPEVEFERKLDVPGAQADEFVDLALLVSGSPTLLLEIKSAKEAQTASGWYRQIRGYASSGTPCVLVVAHDLGEVVTKYLDRVGVRVIDLRTL